jgi:hypothetical protein
MVPPKLARMYGSTTLDTIAGSKLLQVRFGSSFVLQPDQSVIHGGRRARFIRMSDGAALIRYCGGSHAVAVSPESLSLPDEDEPMDGTQTLRPRHHVAQPLGSRNRLARARAFADALLRTQIPRPGSPRNRASP